MSFRYSMLLAALLGAAACSDDDGDDGGQGPGDETGDVLVRNNSFDPAEFQVEAGGTVTWLWESNGVEHNVTFEDDVASDTQGSGTFERTFATAGEFPYLCTLHSGMNGTITVTAAVSGPGQDGY